MTEQEQRTEIAEACGCQAPSEEFFPDYLHDLNAMHDAIMSQPQEIRMKINDTLMHLIDAEAPYCLDRTINATAAQRAEAFLKTIGKWKDS